MITRLLALHMLLLWSVPVCLFVCPFLFLPNMTDRECNIFMAFAQECHKMFFFSIEPFFYYLDCEHSLFFFIFSESNALARQPEKKKEPSVTRVAICVSRVLLDGQKKERLVVYLLSWRIIKTVHSFTFLGNRDLKIHRFQLQVRVN